MVCLAGSRPGAPSSSQRLTRRDRPPGPLRSTARTWSSRTRLEAPAQPPAPAPPGIGRGRPA
eukprot:6000040-Alexandrium_andersonii.AAC.1